MPYESPGGAFSNALDKQLMAHETRKRQAMLDTLAVQREADLAKYREQEITIRRDEAAQRVQQFKDSQDNKDLADFHKTVGEMVKGDIPTAELLAKDKKYGTNYFPMTAPAPTVPVPASAGMQIPGAVGADTGLPADPAGAPLVPPAPPAALQPPPQAMFIGRRDERLAEDQRTRQQAFIDALPASDPRKQEMQSAFGAEQAGLKVPPGFFQKPQATKQRFIFDPVKKVYTDPQGNVVTDLPTDAVVDRSAEPKDTSARDVARQNHVDQIREHAYTELNARAKPTMDQIERINKLETSLGENSNIADSTIAEQLVTLTAGGNGSGVRISQPMINQVLEKSRTKWEDFSQALKRWDAAPPKDKADTSLFFTPDQKQAMRNLARAYRQKANEVHKRILDARHKIDEATDVSGINKIRTAAEEEIFSEPTSGAASGSGKPQIKYDMNGNMVKP